MAWCNKVLVEDPDNPKAIYRQANAQLASGNYQEAIADFRRYAQADPSDADHAESMVARATKRQEVAEARQRKQLRGFMD